VIQPCWRPAACRTLSFPARPSAPVGVVDHDEHVVALLYEYRGVRQHHDLAEALAVTDTVADGHAADPGYRIGELLGGDLIGQDFDAA
jgi:hypothetical protein